MEPQRWAEIESIYHAALAKTDNERKSYLDAVCSGDVGLRSEVESLLDHAEARLPNPFDAASWETTLRSPKIALEELFSQPLMVSSRASIDRPFDIHESFEGTPRFDIQGRLGAGTFGVVYRAFDRERNSPVALKVLRNFDPLHLVRFKREFRSLVDLAHPNLVQLYELFGDDHHWFFTMELVEGVDFISYVRPGNSSSTREGLRDALFHLASGIQALHSSGRLHRDLKPSNVLVTAQGRVVILDFGLVKEFPSTSVEQSFALAGSPAYMAPEQAAGGPINEAADWYAVGVILYKALTGRLPFNGEWTEILARKQREIAPRALDSVPDVPQDLDEACSQLLGRDPELRLKGKAILLGGKHRNTETAGKKGEEFVGRTRELRLLRERFEALSSGKRQIVLLEGRSGIGKTSLVSYFLNGVARDYPHATVLSGRCRESEAVPFKALDPIVDELVRYLRSAPEPVATALLPRRPELLKRLFPVFEDLPLFSAFPDRSSPNLEQGEVRRRAFEAFSELLGRMTDRNPVVISIDDLQWGGDLDSIGLLAELIISPNAPALMLILSFRSEEADNSAPIVILRAFKEKLKNPESWLDVRIEGLSGEEGRDLLNLLQAKRNRITEEQSREILREFRGSPLLLSELYRFVSREMRQTTELASGVLISEMIRHRAKHLSSTARQLLEALSVAGEPVSKAILYRAVKVAGEDPASETGLLIREHLARFTGGPQGEYLEPFHDQVREAALAWLSPEELRHWHSRLAELLEGEDECDQQRLLRHYRGAGKLAAAFQAAMAAAEKSEIVLAFEQAARFYAEALETGQAGDAAQANLHRRRAEALATAGHGYEAGQSYLEAAHWPAYNDAIDMRRLAAEQLMRSGYLDEGTKIFADLLRGAGIRVPATRIGTLLSMLAVRLIIRVRGLRWRERREQEIPSEVLRKQDLLWTGGMALIIIDTITGSYLQALHMLTALRAGEPFRLALSLSLGAVYESVGGSLEYEHGRKLISLSQRLAAELDDSYLSTIVYSSWAGIDFLSGRVEDGLSHSRAGISCLSAITYRSRAWELGTLNTTLISFLGWSGQVRQLSDELPAMLEEARSRGDVYAEVTLRCFTTAHLIELANDDPETGIAETKRAIERWRKTHYDLQHFCATFACTECLLYSGRTDEARLLLLSDWQAIRHSLLFRKAQIWRVILFYVRGRTALAEWLRRRETRELRVETEEYAVRLVKTRSPWGDGLSSLLSAGVMAGLGRRDKALALLERGEEILRKQDLRLLAAAALRRRGELQGETGADQIEAADVFMKSESVLRPDRMTAMFLPGNWLQPDIRQTASGPRS